MRQRGIFRGVEQEDYTALSMRSISLEKDQALISMVGFSEPVILTISPRA